MGGDIGEIKLGSERELYKYVFVGVLYVDRRVYIGNTSSTHFGRRPYRTRSPSR